MTAAAPDRPVVQSVDRAVSLLESMARRPWSGVTELADELGVHKSSASRLLATLEARGLAEQHPGTGKYRLGQGLGRLAGAVTARPDLHVARAACERLAELVGETANLAVLEGDEVVHVEQATAGSSLISVDWLGRRAPLHCSSTGKVFLAHLPEARRRALLASPLERRTPHTIVDPRALRAQLEAVLADGYAYTLEEVEPGLHSVAAPVRAADGSLVAALSVSGPAHRVPRSRVPELGSAVRRAASAASARLGYAEAR